MRALIISLLLHALCSEVRASAGAASPDVGDPGSPLSSLGTLELFGQADDGTSLHWVTFSPARPGKHPVVLVIPGGGFIVARTDTGIAEVAKDLAAAGFVALVIEYRLAPPGKLPGQQSAGRFPDQNNDVHLAIRAARRDPRGNGQVAGVGGSAGAYHAAWAAATGSPGEDRFDAGVCLSCAYDFTDGESFVGRDGLQQKIFNFVGSSEPRQLRAASPTAMVSAKIPPLFLIGSADEAAPPQQLPAMVAALRSNGVTNFQQLTLPGKRHSFAYWADVKDQAISFLQSALASRDPR